MFSLYFLLNVGVCGFADVYLLDVRVKVQEMSVTEQNVNIMKNNYDCEFM